MSKKEKITSGLRKYTLSTLLKAGYSTKEKLSNAKDSDLLRLTDIGKGTITEIRYYCGQIQAKDMIKVKNAIKVLDGYGYKIEEP